ncbi:adenosine deaminase [Halosquirtibacter xylanolyticus]|uniref:adenosine deaminase n=1 Tax=Halosquirtibacter xylanolyticus TaxID=3374599 RepID=UPI003747D439|nr:adenosine deaminase [Prolixibacteraceae bacterium]
MNYFIQKLPKAELHLHIEGTLEPELMFALAQRNGVNLKYDNVEALRSAYNFNNLQDFLDLYYAGAAVLLHERDFYDLTMAYLKRVHQDGVVHVELFFDPQTHTERGVKMEAVVKGIHHALEDGQKWLDISYVLIPSFLRHLSEAEALVTWEQLQEFIPLFGAIGLDSSEKGNPPTKFDHVFSKVRESGLKVVAHAGEEGPSAYVWEAIELLKVDRIDHGNRCVEDVELMAEIHRSDLALTMCPLSNLSLKVVSDLSEHPLLELMERGIRVTINSDDPAYFGGYLSENYMQLSNALNLTKEQIIQLARNSFDASFITEKVRESYHKKIDAFIEEYSS